MKTLITNRKPKVSEVTSWDRLYHDVNVEVYEASNIADFYKVTPLLQRSKYFFGETAWMDAQRYAVDITGLSAYGMFN